jgi:hypothetical protein
MKKIFLIAIAFLMCSCTEPKTPRWEINVSEPGSLYLIESFNADSVYIYPDGRLYFESEYFSGTVKKGYYSLKYFNL